MSAKNKAMFDFQLLEAGDESAKPACWKIQEPEVTLEEHLAAKKVEKEDAVWQRGFLKPDSVKIPEFADRIIPEQELLCKLVMAYASDDIYLITADQFPDKVEDYIATMTKFYKSLMKAPKWADLMVDTEYIRVGGIVAVWFENCWQRAQVEKVPEKPNDDSVYVVMLIDVAERVTVGRRSILYLHVDFTLQEAWSVRCRLPRLDEWFNESGLKKSDRAWWEKEVLKRMLRLVFNQDLVVKFVKKVETDKGRPLWEVILVHLLTKRRTEETIEQQAIMEMISF